MDVRVSRHYVARAMSFLLVLSAVLNALTGAFAGARAPEPGLHQQASVQIAAAVETVQQAAMPASRIEQPLPPIADDWVFASETATPPPAAPLETVRLIE